MGPMPGMLHARLMRWWLWAPPPMKIPTETLNQFDYYQRLVAVAAVVAVAVVVQNNYALNAFYHLLE